MIKTKILNIFLKLFILLVGFTACKQEQKKIKSVSNLSPKLEKLWETDSLFTTCESVIFDKNNSIIYVANVNNNPWEKDNNGFISKINTDGKVINLKWIEGLHGPKGMGIFNGKLYVNDIDQIVEIDIAEGKITSRFTIEEEPQLNDITIASNGTIFASGSNSNTIYTLKNGNLNKLQNTNFKRLNGLLSTSQGLYFAESSSHQFGIYNLKTNKKTVLTKEIGHGDGIVMLPNKDFIVSNWQGEIYYIYASNWSKKLLLDTKEVNINAADIDFIPELNMLLIPTFFNNKVVSYKLSYIDSIK